MNYSRINLSSYCVISIWFDCNNDCAICMLGDMKRRLPAINFDHFRRVVSQIRNDGRFRNLILSGAEVTTFDDVDRYVQFAASLGWFKKIQIQTNGRRLADKDYIRYPVVFPEFQAPGLQSGTGNDDIWLFSVRL